MNLPDKAIRCHLTGFAKPCRSLVSSGACTRWKHLLGTNPQTGAEIAMWDCVDNLQHTILLQLGRAHNELTASVDKQHNGAERRHTETMASQGALIHGLTEAAFVAGAHLSGTSGQRTMGGTGTRLLPGAGGRHDG